MLFERASKQKLRIKTANGNVTVEDLWDIPLLQLKILGVLARKQDDALEQLTEEQLQAKLQGLG